MDSGLGHTYKTTSCSNQIQALRMSNTAQVIPTDFAQLRQMMVDCQIRTFDVTDQAVLTRFIEVPREAFLPPQLAPLAYSDASVSLGGKTERRLLTPMILARLIQGADIKPGDRVLDVAGGCGYTAALLAGLGASVTTLEDDASLTDQARAALTAQGFGSVTTLTGPLTAGAPAAAPFDVILVNGAIEEGLEALFAQLAPGGRLVTLKTDLTLGRAIKAMRFDKVGVNASSRLLFDGAATSVLKAFAKKPSFAF